MQAHKPQSVMAIRLRAHARIMRRCPTPSESVLWQHIKAKKLGVQFRRQQIVGSTIVDFLAPRLKLAVEVDGGYHEHKAVALADARHEARLRRAGYHVLRLSASLVLEQPAEAVAQVRAAIARIVAGAK